MYRLIISVLDIYGKDSINQGWGHHFRTVDTACPWRELRGWKDEESWALVVFV
jgi:hypothetical protein